MQERQSGNPTDRNLKIKTKCGATGILSDKSGVTGVALNNGSEIICIDKGVRPNVEFLSGSEIITDQVSL